MIVEKIDKLLKNGNSLVGLEDFKNTIEWALKRQLQRQESKAKLRCSLLGHCPKKIAYMLMGEDKRELQPRARVTFLFGDIIEAIAVTLIKSASGIELIDQQKEIDFEGVKGHIDGVVIIDNKKYLFECKSMSDFSFRDLQRTGLDNTWGYLTQTNVYLEALGLNEAILFAINKNTGAFDEVLIKKDFKIIEEAKRTIKMIREFEKTGKLPPRKFDFVPEFFRKKETGKYILPVQCSYCAYLETCWSGQYEKVLRYRRPKYYKI